MPQHIQDKSCSENNGTHDDLAMREHAAKMELINYQLETARKQREMAEKEHEAKMKLISQQLGNVDAEKKMQQEKATLLPEGSPILPVVQIKSEPEFITD